MTAKILDFQYWRNKMIQQSQIKEASFDVRRKSKLCHAYERGDKVYVVPFDETKDHRIVLFLSEGILCFSTDGVFCEANFHGRRACYHVLAANRRKEINAKRRATLAGKHLVERQGRKVAA